MKNSQKKLFMKEKSFIKRLVQLQRIHFKDKSLNSE